MRSAAGAGSSPAISRRLGTVEYRHQTCRNMQLACSPPTGGLCRSTSDMVAHGLKLQSPGHALLASPASITSPCEQLFDIDLVRQGAQQSTRITAKTAQTKQYPSPGTRPTTSQIYRMDVAYQKPCSNFSHVLSHDINHVLKEEASKEAPSLCQHLAFRKATTICCSVRQVTEHFDLDAVASSRSRFPLRFRY